MYNGIYSIIAICLNIMSIYNFFLKYKISNRAVAAIFNTFIYYKEMITDGDMSKVIDITLIRRWKFESFQGSHSSYHKWTK